MGQLCHNQRRALTRYCVLNPILYSFRRCPYAIRARLAIVAAGLRVELRETVLRNKPAPLLAASAKGTVPVLVLSTGEVIDESIDIMTWALKQSDPLGWLNSQDETATLVLDNDGDFKHWLDRYKYADRWPAYRQTYYRTQAEFFLARLERQLVQHSWLAGEQAGFADVAIFPFVRQFASVDRAWFDVSPYMQVRHWLDSWLASSLFQSAMVKHAQWHPGDVPTLFPGIAN